MIRTATSVWNGTGKEGNGSLSTGSGVLRETPYNFNMRFGDAPGTNPEELIGAALAGCYNMKLSFVIVGMGFTPTRLKTTAEVKFEGGVLSQIHLVTHAAVPAMQPEQFQQAANDAKVNCPVSKALASVSITLDASLTE